jgi:hypothetical protein
VNAILLGDVHKEEWHDEERQSTLLKARVFKRSFSPEGYVTLS